MISSWRPQTPAAFSRSLSDIAWGPTVLAPLAAVALGAAVAFHGRALFAITAAAAFVGMVAISPARAAAVIPVPTLLIAALNKNPFPTKVEPLALAALLVGSLILSREGRVSIGAVARMRVVWASVGLIVVMGIRLLGSPAQVYGTTKFGLFALSNAVVVVIGVAVAVRGGLRRYLRASLLVLAAGATLFVYKLAEGRAVPTVGGRYSLTPEQWPIWTGRAASYGLLVAGGLLLAGTQRRERLLIAAALVPLGVELFASGSRGPVLGLLFGVVSVLVAVGRLGVRLRRVVTVSVALIGLGVLVLPLVVPSAPLGRIVDAFVGSAGSASTNGRADLWHAAARGIWSGHPVVGAGTGSFAVQGLGANYPHNLVLEVGYELGVVGLFFLAVFLAAAASVVRKVISGRVVGDPGELAVLSGLVVAAFVNAMLSGDIQNNSELWLFAGLASGTACRAAVLRRAPSTSVEGRAVRAITMTMAQRRGV